MASKSLIERIEEDLAEISARTIDAIIDGLEKEELEVKISHYTAQVWLNERLTFTIWIANGMDSIKCYDSGANSIDLKIGEPEQERLWKALNPYKTKQEQQDLVFKPKVEEKPEEKAEEEIAF